MRPPLRPILYVGLLVITLLFLNHCIGQHRIVRVSDRAEVTMADVMDDLRQVRLVFVGEVHDQEEHHMMQLAIIQGLRDRGVRLAIGLEMFRNDSQTNLDRWTSGKLSEASFEPLYYDNWNFPLKLYRDIFFYARDNQIRMVGLNISREITHQVAQEGFASLSPEQVGELPEVRCDVDATYEDFIRRSFDMHEHGGMEFIYFCEAQLVWDTVMAWNLLQFLADNPDHVVVVLAGNGHAWKRCIPEQVRRRSKMPYRVILPEPPGSMAPGSISLDDADYIWTNPYRPALAAE